MGGASGAAGAASASQTQVEAPGEDVRSVGAGRVATIFVDDAIEHGERARDQGQDEYHQKNVHGRKSLSARSLPRVADLPQSIEMRPRLWHAGTMLANVATLVFDGVAPFELGVACEAFGLDRSDDGVPSLDFAVCGPAAGPVRTNSGFSLVVDHGLERAAEADLLVVPALPHEGTPRAVLDTLVAGVERGARVLSVCGGAFVLGEAGLLDDRDCTTHWRYTRELTERFPKARIIPDVLYVDAGAVITSAGTAAGIDAALHIWRKEFGSAVANAVARRMVVPPQREGGQAQFLARVVPECTAETLGPLLEWVRKNLQEDLGVEALAKRALMSPRTFARRFRDETGTTPHAWVTSQRIHLAEELLERTDESVDQIATRAGFANAATLRHHFLRVRGVAPNAYRRMFAC